MADTTSGLPGRCWAPLQRSPGRRRAVGGLIASALVLGLAACSALGGGTVATSTQTTAVPTTASRSYTTAEAPNVIDRDSYAFRTLTALRPGATYRLRMPGNLYPDAPQSHLAVELTVSGDTWWLFEQGVVVQKPSYLREDAGIRVMEMDQIPYGPCQDQPHVLAVPGPAPADLADAILSRYPFTVIETVAPVERFGGSGVHLVAQLNDPKASLCDNGGVMTYRAMAGQGQLVELWIIAVRGESVVVERSWFPDTSPGVVEQQQRTLETLRLVRL